MKFKCGLWVTWNIEVKFPDLDYFSVIMQGNVFILRKYALKHLWAHGHIFSKWLLNGSKTVHLYNSELFRELSEIVDLSSNCPDNMAASHHKWQLSTWNNGKCDWGTELFTVPYFNLNNHRWLGATRLDRTNVNTIRGKR